MTGFDPAEQMAAHDNAAPTNPAVRFSLRDQLYLLAHDDETGRPIAHLPSLSLGLAGAIVLDLYLGRRIRVDHDYLVIHDPRPCGDAIADHATAELAAKEYALLTPWLYWLADDLYESLTRYLVATGVLTTVRGRRLGVLPITRTGPANPAFPP